MASPECITLDSGSDSDSDVEFICAIKNPTTTNELKNESKNAKREVDFISIVDLEKEEDKTKEAGIFKQSGRKMVSDAVEIVSSISAVQEDNNTMKIEQVFSLKMSDNESTPQKRRSSSTTVMPRPFTNSPQVNQQRQSNSSTPLQKTSAQNQLQRNVTPHYRNSPQMKPTLPLIMPLKPSQKTDNSESTLQKLRRFSTTFMPLPSTNSPQVNRQRQSNSSTPPQKTSAQNQLQRNVTPHWRNSAQMKPTFPFVTPIKPSQLMQKDNQKEKIKIVPVPTLRPITLAPKASPSKPKPSLTKPKPSSLEPKASSSRVPTEAIVLSDTDDEKSQESEHDSESETSPNVKLSKELIMKLVDVCLNSKLRDDLKKKIKEKLTRYMDGASPNVLKRNYFIRMVKDFIKDVEAILDCPEIYESHEVTLCDKIKAVIAELKKDSLIVNNKLIKLTNIYNKLKRRIQRLEETEVDTDDESVNPYLLLDKYQKRATVVYNKMCEIQNIGNHADRPYLLPFSFKGKGPEPLERALEVYYNKTRKFPNFKEVLKLTKKVNEEKKLGMSEPEVNYTAQSVFTDFGRRLQMRRQRDDYHNLVGYIQDGERDPATEDPELNRKLELNKHLYITKEQEVLDTYVKKQAMKDGKKNAEESEEESNQTDESSDGESENESKHSGMRSRLSSEEKSPKEDSPEKDTVKDSVRNPDEKVISKEKKREIRSRSNSEEKSPKKPRREDPPEKGTEEKSSEKVISKEKKHEIRSRSNSEEKSPKKPRREDSPEKATEGKSSEKVISKEKKHEIRSRSNSEEKSPKKPRREDSPEKATEEKSSEKVISEEKTPEKRSSYEEKSPKKPKREDSREKDTKEKSSEEVSLKIVSDTIELSD